jgi:DNA polymerase-3 subunit delta'
MLRDLHFEPIRGKKRVFLIRDAEGLGKGKADSGNSLLKTLEEPPPYAHFILTAETPAAVPQTILSRCQIIRFHRVPTQEIHALLVKNGIDGHLAEFLAAYSEGRPGVALRLARAPGLLEARATILQIAHSLIYSPTISGFKLSEEFRKTAGKLKLAADDSADSEEEKSSRDTLLLGLDLVATYFRDLLAAVVSGEAAKLAHPDLRKETMIAARHISAATLQASVQRILAVRSVIARNASSQLAIDVLFTGLAGIGKA